MEFIEGTQIEQILDFPTLIEGLKQSFCADITVPLRHHHDFSNPVEGVDSTLLLMPAWEAGKYLGVKVVTVAPNNGKFDLPSIQGQYLLLDAHKGTPLANMDAKALTVKRTAAASALASSFLSNPESSSLLMVGTGALAPNLIEAHASVRPIKNVLVWGRNRAKAELVKNQLAGKPYTVEVVEDLQEAVGRVDIVSCATLSASPLLFGEWIRPGQHIDLVGAYKPDMREADDVLITKVALYVDNYLGAKKETGDLAIPLKSGILKEEDLLADLFALCRNEKSGRVDQSQITCFKSVGHALEDLTAAKIVYEQLMNSNNG